MLNGRHQGIFQPLKTAAWRAHCARNPGVSPQDKIAEDHWYRQTLVTSIGIYSTKEIADKDERLFESLCLCFATIAGDEKQITYWSRAEERRALWRLEQSMRVAGVTRAYVDGIAVRMGFLQDQGAMAIEDLPAELILKLNTALFIHNKRKERQCATA